MPIRTLARCALAPLAIALACAAAMACARGGATGGEPFSLVSIEAVERMLSEPGVAVIDANTKKTFDENHLPGARYYKSAPFAQLLPADKDARILFYCASPS